jgi:hypothetical protein
MVIVISTIVVEMVRTTNSITVGKVPLMGDAEKVAIASSSIRTAWEIAVVPIMVGVVVSALDFELGW